jgi:DNA-binding MarR family transcriptional regulator
MSETHDPSEEDDSPAGEGPGFLIWHAANTWQKAQKEALAPFDLTPVQCLLLAGIDELAAGGDAAIKQSDLARHTRSDVMMTSQVIRALEKRGLVVRATHKEDGRAVALRLTGDGRALLGKARPALAETDARFFAGLGDRRDEFCDALMMLAGEKRRRRVKAVGG